MVAVSAACPVEDMRPGEHRCFVYDTDADLLEVTRTCVRTGLARGEKVYYLAGHPAEAMPPARIVERLAGGVRWREGQLVVLSVDRCYLLDGRFDPDRTEALMRGSIAVSAAQGYPACRVAGETNWWRYGLPGTDRLAEYERSVQRVFDESTAMALCLYDSRVFGPALETFVDAHTGQVEPPPDYADGLVRITRFAAPRGLRLTGEVDLSNHRALGRALSAMAAGQEGDVHVDVRALTFVDVQGLRTLVQAAAALEDGRHLVLHGASAAMRRLLAIVGWDSAANLRWAD